MKAIFGMMMGLFALMVSVTTFASVDAGKKALQEKRYGAAMSILRPLADAGEAEAQFLVGTLYETGGAKDSASLADTLPIDKELALKYFEQSATNGNTCGAFAAGMTHLIKSGLGDRVGKKFIKIGADAETSLCQGRSAWVMAVLLVDGAGSSFGRITQSGAVEYAKRAIDSGVDFYAEKIAMMPLPLPPTQTTVNYVGGMGIGNVKTVVSTTGECAGTATTTLWNPAFRSIYAPRHEYSVARSQNKSIECLGSASTPQQFLARIEAYNQRVAQAETAKEIEEREAAEDDEDNKLAGWNKAGKGLKNFLGLMLDNDHSEGAAAKVDRHNKAAERERAAFIRTAAFNFFIKQEYKSAYQLFSHQADRGWAEAKIFTGLMLHDGLGIAKDDDKAFLWLARAYDPLTNNGHAAADSYTVSNTLPERRAYYARGYYYLGNYYADGARCEAEGGKDCRTFFSRFSGQGPQDATWLRSENLAGRYWQMAADFEFVPAMIAQANWQLQQVDASKAISNQGMLYRSVAGGGYSDSNVSAAHNILMRAKGLGSEEAAEILGSFEETVLRVASTKAAERVAAQPAKKDLKEQWKNRGS